MNLVVFPHQLFYSHIKQVIKKYNIQQVVLWEDPTLYGDRGPMQLRLNRLRLTYMYVSVRRFVETMKCQHITVDELWPLTIAQRQARFAEVAGPHTFVLDPADHLLLERLGPNIEVIDSPMFLLTRAEVAAYPYSGQHLRHAPFYAFMKKKLNILLDTPNMDAQNRRPYPQNAPAPPHPYVKTGANSLWIAAREWLEHHPVFAKNPGPSQPIAQIPTDRREALAWLAKFVRERLDKFGAYQDAIVTEEPWMFHSGCSIFLNCGLLTPTDVISAVQKHPTSMTNKEGFLRQLIGWRELARLYYERIDPKIWQRNIFGHTKRKLSAIWYTATTGIPIVDEAITDAWRYGYLHHIRRLMVISNWMNLSGVHPDAAFQWMSEFALDAADWVMVFNVYAMGMWADGGHTMRKPYISSSAYVKRMAHTKAGPWAETWDAAYRTFLEKHKEILKHTPIAGPKRRDRD
jgi:deoxyribodipyrimidine photolyase-related protein